MNHTNYNNPIEKRIVETIESRIGRSVWISPTMYDTKTFTPRKFVMIEMDKGLGNWKKLHTNLRTEFAQDDAEPDKEENIINTFIEDCVAESKRLLSNTESSLEVFEETQRCSCYQCNRYGCECTTESINDPDLDGTDLAHPAWWRGNDAGVESMVFRINEILDLIEAGEQDKGMFSSQKLNMLRDRLYQMYKNKEKHG